MLFYSDDIEMVNKISNIALFSCMTILKFELKFHSFFPINNIPASVHKMAWCRIGAKQLSEPMMVILLTHICVTQIQWVNGPQFWWRFLHGVIISLKEIILLIFFAKIIHHVQNIWVYIEADSVTSIPSPRMQNVLFNTAQNLAVGHQSLASTFGCSALRLYG